ncbi:tubulin-specific chaperone D-like [Hydractinia symbiolongicarpus]|uniref:tubulin-specific chaperone D-like n=1 Tax=Hydractinia symbiolongicarpus TaxID=13093 RepID=UPI00254C46C0|nr:tubulin-specific chaperone D-like [Hydractinia symbiolongicarpus]XP_057310362.1 tubulin-specific chaperone D-like [Hydractinia symbiolongicarpus]XP_057310363.1 tubulin-specific chaperone D-like [Hydractinia symbiolongicarpus]
MTENISTHILERFKETDEVHKIIDQTLKIHNDDILLETDLERLTVILDEYQEQPHLLDPFLEQFVTKLLDIVKSSSTQQAAFHQAFRYLYLFTKVRGYKQIIRLFSHDVSDLEFVLKLLHEQSPTEYQTWETRYILLLWLAIVCIIPFDLKKLDGASVSDDESVLNRVLKSALPYLNVFDKSKDAAAYLTAKFLTRPDVKSVKLPEFFNWALDVLPTADKSTMIGMHTITGVLATLALIFKHGRREDLLPHASRIFNFVEQLEVLDIQNTLIRKLAVKLVQRVGLVFLAPRVVSWRYMRGSRSLGENLQLGTVPTVEEKDEGKKNTNEEEFDIPEEVESVLEFLMTGLKDKDTIVRWSAAKGVGRITGRLPEELADEVVGSLLELFTFSELDGAWHGGCLALAELGRRGLLLPSRLPEVVPIVLKALTYDERRGSYSVGSHVRDAACYVCWSFARAYDPHQIKPFVLDIARALLLVTIFDREINCRRAASAAFQENVGRQGSFPHGIDIVTTADYFTVSNRTNCYISLSVFVAEFPEYTQALIDHLVAVKISHWDSAIRELTSHALHNLTAVAPVYMLETALPLLINQMQSIDICTKHGAILAVGEVVHALSEESRTKTNIPLVLNDSILNEVMGLVSKLKRTNQFRGYGGELMRKAVCRLIEKIASSDVKINDTSVLDDWLFVIVDTISHTAPTVRYTAITALPPFCQQYMTSSTHFKIDILVQSFCSKLKAPLKFDRMGFAQALGVLPNFMIESTFSEVVKELIETCKVSENKSNAGIYAEARWNAVEALLKICKTVGVTYEKLKIQDMYDCFFDGLKDYTMDSRGDVGAWVREASMTALVELTYMLVEEKTEHFTPDICEKIMCCLVQQASEKIDRTRVQAGKLLLQFIHHSPEIPYIKHKEELTQLLPNSMLSSLNWLAPDEGFEAITRLLHLKTYQYSILLGLTISAGGLTESLVRHSSDYLLAFLTKYQESETDLDVITENLLKIFQTHSKDDRVVIPMLRMLDIILSSGSLELYNDIQKSQKFPLKLLLSIKDEMKSCGEVKKILASINIFCGLLQFEGDVRTKSLQHVMMYLCHKYPRIRKATAEQLYTTFLTYDDILPAECADEVTIKLTDVAWDNPVDSLRPIRNEICGLLNIPPPKLKKNVSQTSSSSKEVDQLDSYKDLVTRHGF